MDIKKLFQSFAKKTLGLKDDDFAALFEADDKPKSDALDVLMNKDAERVGTFKEKETASFNNGFNKAKAEVLGEFETSFKDEFKFQSDKKGLELVKDFVATQVDAKNITDDQVIGHPKYKLLEKAMTDAVKAKDVEWQQKWDGQQGELKMKETLAHVRKEANAVREELNLLLPEDEKLRQNQLSWFDKEVEAGRYETAKDGKIFMLDESGKKLEDGHGYPVEFKDHIKGIATKYWPLANGQKRKTEDPNAKTKTNSQQQPPTWKDKVTLRKASNENELMKIVGELNDNKELNPNELSEARLHAVALYKGEVAE